jgi:hypothetical protein
MPRPLQLGHILFQKDEIGRQRDVGYFSKALNPMERNYDIWDREFMAVVWGLRNWRHLLVGSPYKIIVHMDHANLQYYQHPQKINRRVARYISTIADYNMELRHLPGPKNRADPLSRRPDFDDGTLDNEEVTALPNELFAKTIEMTALDQQIVQRQHKEEAVIEEMKERWKLQKRENTWWRGSTLVIVNPESIQKGIVDMYHKSTTGGHPGALRTFQQITKDYWWPDLRKYVQAYVKGCATCQQNKTMTRRNNPPINPIFPPENPEPFKVISVDLITKLLESNGSNAILTITDQGSTKGVILIACKEEMGTEEIVKLYKEKAFPYIGLPSKLISDRDTRFTSKMFKELCQQLGVEQNMSLAYHPQTDGESERTNQTVETALRIFGNFRQMDWSEWLPLVQYQINSHISNTTHFAPFEVWMGYIPRAHQPDRPSSMPEISKRKEQLKEIRQQAQESMARAQQSWVKENKHAPYSKGQRVWLEGRNLKTSHPTVKLRPKRFGPFKITEILGPTTYRLALPPSWRIHNVFHAALLTPYISKTRPLLKTP